MKRQVRAARLAVIATMLATGALAPAAPAMAWSKPLWIRQFGTAEYDYAEGVATDATGNVYVTGRTSGALGGPNRGGDAWLAKVDAANHVLWKRQLGTGESDDASGVATDTAGNVYIAGRTNGSLGGPNRGFMDAWVAKLDPAGHLQWTRQLGTDQWDWASGVATDVNGNVYLTGATRGSLGGPNSGGADHHTEDAWAAKYDAAGHLLWIRHMGTAEYDIATGVATDATGNAYVAGLTVGSLFGPNRGGGDAWLAAYNPAGHLLWKRQVGTADYDEASGVATDTVGNVYIAGRTYGSLGGPYAGGNGDAWVRKYDAAGHVQWTRQLGTTQNDWWHGVATDAAGNVYLTGETGFVQGDGYGNYYGDYDAWVAGYDAAGHLLWKRQLGTAKFDVASSVATDAAGHVYIAGYTSGSLGGLNHGGPDAFVAKYSTQR